VVVFATKLRFLIAICVSFVIFVIVVFTGTLFGGMGLLKVLQMFYGKEYHGVVLLPAFIVSAYISFILSRYIFKKILGVHTSLINGENSQINNRKS
jgi:hypothetical protein